MKLNGSMYYIAARKSWAYSWRGGDGKIKIVYARNKEDLLEKRIGKERKEKENPPPKPDSFGVLFEKWLKVHKETLKPAVAHRYQLVGQKYLIPLLGKYTLDQIRPMVIQDLMIQLQKTLATNTALYILAVLSSACQQFVVWDLIATNPCTQIRKPKRKRNPPVIWDTEELKRLKKYLEYVDPQEKGILLLAITSGARQGEIFALTWEDLGEDDITINKTLSEVNGKIICQPPKSLNSNRIISVPKNILDHIRGLDRRSDLVFSDPTGKPWNPRCWCKSHYGRILRQAGVPKIKFHALRHLHATILLEEGFGVEYVSKRLGHANLAFTYDTYCHLRPKYEKEKLPQLSEIFNKI